MLVRKHHWPSSQVELPNKTKITKQYRGQFEVYHFYNLFKKKDYVCDGAKPSI
jgi:hypothetical protein